MSNRPIILAPEHGCTIRKPGRCSAVRCTNGCGEYEHSANAPEDCLQHDLRVAYVEGHWCGPGLIVLLQAALMQPKGSTGESGGNPNGPGSRPPGWDADASALLVDISSRRGDRDTMADWRRQARAILGFSVPSVALPGVSCFVCGEASLRVAQDASSDVWCSNRMCHNTDDYPHCTLDNLGYDGDLGYAARECRKTEKSLTHSVRWKRDSWAPIWQQMQEDRALNGDQESERISA